MIDDPLSLNDYLELYRNQPPRQAQLLIPAWVKRWLNALPEEDRHSILMELDGIAGSYGLLTPVDITVMSDG